MGYEFNSAQLFALQNNIIKIYGECYSLAEDTKSKLDALHSSGSMKGPGADNLLGYLIDVHEGTIQSMLKALAESVLACCREYYAQYVKVDSQCDAVIDTDELLDIQTQLRRLCHNGNGSYFNVEKSMKSTMKKVSDVSSQRYSGLPSGVSSEFSTADKKLQKIVDDISTIETTYRPQMADIVSAIEQLKHMILGPCAQVSVGSYSPDAFFSDAAYASLYHSISAVGLHYSQWAANSEQTNDALAGVEEQWAQRAEEAEKIKAGITLITSIAAVVVTVAIPGAGVVGGAAIQAAAGLISGAVCEGVDQWASGAAAANGGYDFGSILYEGFKTGGKDFVTGLAGGYFGKLSAGAGIVKKTGYKMAENLIGETVDFGVELLDAAVDGDFAETWKEINTGEKWAERAGKLVTSSVTDIVLDEGTKNMFGLDDLKKTNPNTIGGKITKFGGMFLGEGFLGAVEGKFDNATDAAWEGFIVTSHDGKTQVDWQDGANAFTDSLANDNDDILKDFVTGGLTSATTSAIEDSDWYENRLNQSIRQNDQLKDELGHSKYQSYGRTPDGTVVIEGTATSMRTDVSDRTYINTQEKTTITVSENEYGSKLFTVTNEKDHRVRSRTPEGDIRIQEHVHEQTSVTQKEQKSGRISYSTTTQFDHDPEEAGKSTAAEKAELRDRKADYKVIKDSKARQDKAVKGVVKSTVKALYTWADPEAEPVKAPTGVPVSDYIAKMRPPGYKGAGVSVK